MSLGLSETISRNIDGLVRHLEDVSSEHERIRYEVFEVAYDLREVVRRLIEDKPAKILELIAISDDARVALEAFDALIVSHDSLNPAWDVYHVQSRDP